MIQGKSQSKEYEIDASEYETNEVLSKKLPMLESQSKLKPDGRARNLSFKELKQMSLNNLGILSKKDLQDEPDLSLEEVKTANAQVKNPFEGTKSVSGGDTPRLEEPVEAAEKTPENESCKQHICRTPQKDLFSLKTRNSRPLESR